LASIESFIKGKNLCQALECTKKILGTRVEKTKKKSTATGSNNEPCTSKDIDKSKNSKAASSDFKEVLFLYFLYFI